MSSNYITNNPTLAMCMWSYDIFTYWYISHKIVYFFFIWHFAQHDYCFATYLTNEKETIMYKCCNNWLQHVSIAIIYYTVYTCLNIGITHKHLYSRCVSTSTYVFSLQNPTQNCHPAQLRACAVAKARKMSWHHAPARQLPPRQITPGDTRSGATLSPPAL